MAGGALPGARRAGRRRGGRARGPRPRPGRPDRRHPPRHPRAPRGPPRRRLARRGPGPPRSAARPGRARPAAGGGRGGGAHRPGRRRSARLVHPHLVDRGGLPAGLRDTRRRGAGTGPPRSRRPALDRLHVGLDRPRRTGRADLGQPPGLGHRLRLQLGDRPAGRLALLPAPGPRGRACDRPALGPLRHRPDPARRRRRLRRPAGGDAAPERPDHPRVTGADHAPAAAR